MSTVPVRLGAILRPQQAPKPRFFIGETSQESVAKTLLVSSNAFEGVGDWLSNIRPADWNQKASQVSDRAALEIANLSNNVLGKLGSDEAEQTAGALQSKWQTLKDKADYALANPPGTVTTWWDSVSRYFSDFGQGYTGDLSGFTSAWSDAWQGFSSFVVEKAGPLLQTYHDDINKIMFFQDDLAKAKASGQFSQADLLAQEQNVRDMQAAADKIRSTFATLSTGASIDELAQRQFGNYSGLGQAQAAAIPIGTLLVIVSLAVLLYMLTRVIEKGHTFVYGVSQDAPQGTTNPNAPGSFPIGAIGLIALLAIPLYLMSKDS